MPIGQAKFGLLGGVVDIPPMEHIQTITASNVSEVIFNTIEENKYQTHLLITTKYSMVSSQAFNPSMQLYENGTLQTGSVYEYAEVEGRVDSSGGSKLENKSTGLTVLKFMTANVYTTSDVASGYAYLYNLGDSNKMSFCTYSNYAREENNKFRFFYGSSILPNTSSVDGFRITAAQNFNGIFELYGVTGK